MNENDFSDEAVIATAQSLREASERLVDDLVPFAVRLLGGPPSPQALDRFNKQMAKAIHDLVKDLGRSRKAPREVFSMVGPVLMLPAVSSMLRELEVGLVKLAGKEQNHGPESSPPR